MAFQALRRSFKAPSFESLEPRQLLDGVTAQFAHAFTTPTALYVDVKYKAAEAVDVATLSDDDILVTRAAGIGPALTLAATLAGPPRTDWDGGTLVRYKVDAPDDFYGQWWFGSDNGAYTISVAAGAVSSILGATNEAADLRTLNLWFNNQPRLEFDVQGLNVVGLGYPGGTLPANSAAMDEARVFLGYRMANLGVPIRSVQVTLTGPNGESRTITTAPELSSFTTIDTTALARMNVIFPVPKSASDTSANGTWDFSDAGAYHVSIRFAPTTSDPNPTVVLERDYVVTSPAPQGEIADVAIEADYMLVTMRYNHPSGIDLASLGTGDIKLAMPGNGVASGSLVGSPTEVDGVVTAVYRIDAPAAGWSSIPTGKVQLRTGLYEVRSNNGGFLGFALTRELNVATAGRVKGVVTDSYSTAAKFVVVVRYSSDQAIDSATLGDDDVQLTGPLGYNRFGHLAQVVPQNDGSVLAVYHFASSSTTGLWDFRSGNGAYVATLAADTVREVGGTGGNAAANLKTYSLWFQTPAIELLEASVPWIGSAEPTFTYQNTDAARALLRYTTLEWRPNQHTTHGLVARLTGPDGFVAELIPDGYTPPYRSMDAGFETLVDFRFKPPGGGWDASDNGHYTLSVYLKPVPGQPVYETIFVREFDVNINTPRAQVVSTAITSSAMLVTVQYQAPGGLDLSTLGNGDVALLLRSEWYVFGATNSAVLGTLVGTPTAGANGTATATYRFGSVNGGPWQHYPVATIAVRPQQVADHFGNYIGAPALSTFAIPAAVPDIVNVGSVTASRTAWDVEVSYRNPGNLIQTSSIRPQNLIVTAPDGRATRVSVVSVTVALDGTLRARYRIMPQVGTLRLFDGQYTLALAPNSVSQGAAGYLSAQALGTFNMAFA